MNLNYTDLSSYFNSMNSRGMLLLYRNTDELTFLRKWISEKVDVNAEKVCINSALKNESLSFMVKNCVKCGKVDNKKSGYGTGENGIMILLNTPATISRSEIEKLKENSKDLLVKMVGAINIDLKKCYITNLIKCEADISFKRPGLMLKNCEPILLREILEFKPRIVIVMGDDIPVKKLINENKNISWHKIEHPLSLIKKPELKKSAWAILQNIEKIIENSFQ
jgi:uracil-DNA glycosylase family 4